MGRPSKYSPLRERAVRMVFDHTPEHPSQWATIRFVAEKLGCRVESLRRWVRPARAIRGFPFLWHRRLLWALYGHLKERAVSLGAGPRFEQHWPSMTAEGCVYKPRKKLVGNLPALAKLFMQPRLAASLQATDGWFSSQVGVWNSRSKGYTKKVFQPRATHKPTGRAGRQGAERRHRSVHQDLLDAKAVGYAGSAVG